MDNKNWEVSISYLDFKYTVKGNYKTINQHLSLAVNHLKNQTPISDEPYRMSVDVHGDAPPNIRKIVPDSKTHEVKEQIEEDGRLVTFIKELGTRIEWVYALGMAYYMSEQLDQKLISARQLNDLYDQAGIIRPKNIHLCINQCVRKQYLEDLGKAEKQKTYFITNKGIEFIEKQIQKERSEESEKFYESETQRREATNFLSSLNEHEQLQLKSSGEMSERILIIMYFLRKKGIATHVRPNLIYVLMVEIYGYEGLKRSVHLGLSRTRPLTKKLKQYNKVHYKLTDEGIYQVEQLRA
ncbi:hypothetical protein [Jeotgalibacillus sp. R-1-5s-1]|uniref:hypothetical protein n=1 Tax=Jeotgalibacillus sp. R-1-5s-1 TaxID=2555897 RepID=UPI001069001F|nr:hypothetical protein [Jeotgalibacillus sp. R-1-5s-1]TFD97096.1 hypothetical protein E2491_10430 [Jeotgalibacillus sp. R-1-5s-1]